MKDQPPQPLLYARLESLKKQHQSLDRKVAYEQKNAGAVDYYLKQLKRRKLLLKDEIQDVVSDLSAKAANAC